MPSSIIFSSADHNGYVALPEGLILSGANANVPCTPPTPIAGHLEARLNGGTPLSVWNEYETGTAFGAHQAFFWAAGFFWLFTPGDPVVCAGDLIDFRVRWLYSDASIEYTAWTVPRPFMPGASGLPPVGGSSGGGAGGALATLAGLNLSTTSPVALANPFTDEGTFDLVDAPIAARGMQWQVTSAPSGAGLGLGRLVDYETRVLQLVAYYKMADGAYVAGVIADEHTAQGLVLFDRGTPDHIDYWVAPGFTVSLWWLDPGP